MTDLNRIMSAIVAPLIQHAKHKAALDDFDGDRRGIAQAVYDAKRDIIRAVLEAIREPTDGQLARVHGKRGKGCHKVYSAMIDQLIKELETDLVAAHVLATGDAPQAQFRG